VSATTEVTLPHGLWDGRRRRSEAALRAPTGADEAYLLSLHGRSRAEQVTGLLARCVDRVGELEADDALVQALTVGDREALLLHLRATTFGDRLDCTVDCSRCGERMDVELRISELLVPPYAEVRERHTIALDGPGLRGQAVVRLVTGADQEAAARQSDGEAGVQELVERCVLEVRSAHDPSPLALAEAVSRPLAELDPQAQIDIDAVCPSCGEPVRAVVDAAGLLFAELTAGDERLLREVDALARTYHWGEAEILGLDVRRRRRYLELLAEDASETELG
jgi:hypothetical protein